MFKIKEIRTFWGSLNLSVKILLIIFILEFIFFAHFKIIIGSGMSMYPTIKDKSVLLCSPSSSYKVGDIIYYKIGDKHIVHRITQITNYTLKDNTIIRSYKIKGDNNIDIDSFEIYDENIICKIKFVK